MNIFQIALKNIKQRSLASLLTALSVALGVMLTIAVLVLIGIINRAYTENAIAYDLLIGPKGSDLGLVLSSYYRAEPATSTLPFRYYQQLLEHDAVEEAVPITVGDFTEEGGFPIVGTTSRYFELPYAPGKSFHVTDGSVGMGGPWDAIIGAEVAERNGWKLGSKFKMVHAGTIEQSDHVHDEEFTVVAILIKTGTPNDKSVFVNIEGFFMISGHDKPREQARSRWAKFFGDDALKEFDEEWEKHASEHAHHDHGHDHGHDHHHHAHTTPDILKDVSAIFVVGARSPNSPVGTVSTAAVLLQGEINNGFQARAVNPIQPMIRLKDMIVGYIQPALLALTGLIILVSALGIFVSIYNSMSDRRKDIAVMRALGARRQTVFGIILLESIILCVTGGVLGVILGHGLVWLAAPTLEAETGLIVNPFTYDAKEFIVLPILILLASLVGFIPGITAYKTDVASTLSE